MTSCMASSGCARYHVPLACHHVATHGLPLASGNIQHEWQREWQLMMTPTHWAMLAAIHCLKVMRCTPLEC